MHKGWRLRIQSVLVAVLTTLTTVAFATEGATPPPEQTSWTVPETDRSSEIPVIVDGVGTTDQVDSAPSSAAAASANEVWRREGDQLCQDLIDPEDEVTEPTIATFCVDDTGPTTEDYVQAAAQAFATLVIEPLPIVYQPNTGWALVNKEFIVLVEPEVRDIAVELLGLPVTIRATPVNYSWDFGDGSPPLVTTDPGMRYPNQTLEHVYSSTHPGVIVTLTTSWQGEVVIGGSTFPVPGLRSTAISADPVEIVAMQVRLVP